MPRKPRLRSAAIGLSFLAVLAGGLVAAKALSSAPVSAETPAQASSAATAPVVSAPLTFTTRSNGKVEFADPREVRSELAGVLNGIPDTGAIVEQGQQLFRVADRPVVLLLGDLPMWRDFEPGMTDGADVEQLKRNLADLGFFDGDIDGTYSWHAQQAVMAWQKSVGLAQDAVVPRGRIVFLPHAVRVGDRKVGLGADLAPGTVVYAASRDTVAVSTTVPVADREAVVVGSEVAVVLPGGESATGRVASVGEPRSEEDSSGKSHIVVPVVVTPVDQSAALPHASLPAQVTFSRSTEESVLQVPVSALLAVDAGAYAVEVAGDDGVRSVPVELGRFADGRVEIVGGDLHEGDEVVIAE